MEAGVKYKIALLVIFICFFEVQSVTLQGRNEEVSETKIVKEILPLDSERVIVKRSADWSKRLSPTAKIEDPVHIAEESENVEVTSKALVIVRRMRIQHNRQQNVEMFKEINPESRSSEGGGKIVRVKKFRRKPTRKTTSVPETTSRPSTTTASNVDSMITSSSPYSHITVINKEIRNPKRKKKNKKKRLNSQYIPTPPYDSEPKQNGLMYVTVLPDVHQVAISQPNVNRFNAPGSYPEYRGFYSERQQPLVNNRQNKFSTAEEPVRETGIYQMNRHYNGFQPIMTRISQPLTNVRDMGRSSYQTNSMINRKHSAPMPSFRIYNNENSQHLKPSESSHEEFKNVPPPENIQNDSKKLKSEIPSAIENKRGAKVTLQRTGDSSTVIPAIEEDESDLLKIKNASVARNQNLQPVLHAANAALPQDGRNLRPQLYQFQSRYPSLLYNQQNAFSDPFFDNPEIPSPMHRTPQDMAHPLMSSMHLPFSPFYASNDPQSEEYIFDHGMNPYQSDELIIPGFHHSPHLRSLRRSIIDTYGDETTTSEPVTHFSIPKFEVPSIDFNDKGCQTVYKEVKTVPSDDTEGRNNNAKSFIMTRECYFPNGLPTTEETKEVETTPAPNTTKISKLKSKDLKVDTKES